MSIISSSFLFFCAITLIFIRWRASLFLPNIDPSVYVPYYRQFLAPEIELQLYITGVFTVVVGSIAGWVILRRTRSSLLLRIAAVCFLAVSFELVFFQLNKALAISLITFLALSSLAGIVIRLPKRMDRTMDSFVQQFDMLAAIVIFGASVYAVILLLFPPASVRSFILNQFQSYFYLYAEEYHPLHWLVTFIFTASVFFLWIRRLPFLENLSKVRLIKIFFDSAAFLFIIYFVSVFIPWTQGKYAGIVSYAPVMGPVNDVLGGKTILVDAHSQYGVLFIYALAGLFSFIPLTLDAFFWLNYVTMIAGYLLLYIGIRFWSRSIFGGWLALFLISQHHYFSQHHNMLFFSQNSFLRFGWWVILFVFLIFRGKHKEISSFKFSIFNGIEVFLVGMAAFWAFDTGVYTLAAYLSFLFVYHWINGKTFSQKLRGFTTSLGLVGLTLLIFFLGISFFTKFRAGQWPDWFQYIAPAFEFSGGFHLTPMPLVGMHYAVIFVYLAILTFVLYRLFLQKIGEQGSGNLAILAFVATYGVFQFFYYVGESTNGNLHIVILPFLVLCAWLAVSFRAKVPLLLNMRFPQKTLLAALTVFLFILFSVVTLGGIENTFGIMARRGPLSSGLEENSGGDPAFRQSVTTINDYLDASDPPYRRVAIVSAYDWIFHINTKSVDVMDVNNILDYYRISQLEELGRQLLERNPPVVFVDHVMTYSGWNIVVEYVKQGYRFRENAGFLDIWEKTQEL